MHIWLSRVYAHLLKIDFSYPLKNTKILSVKNHPRHLAIEIGDPSTLVQPQVFNLEIGMMRFLIASMS